MPRKGESNWDIEEVIDAEVYAAILYLDPEDLEARNDNRLAKPHENRLKRQVNWNTSIVIVAALILIVVTVLIELYSCGVTIHSGLSGCVTQFRAAMARLAPSAVAVYFPRVCAQRSLSNVPRPKPWASDGRLSMMPPFAPK